MRHADAYRIAVELVDVLRPACERIEIAGSIRRQKAEVKDIEIVAVPSAEPPTQPRLEFGKKPVFYRTKVDEVLQLQQDRFKIEFEKSGDKYKKFTLGEYGISVDLFLATPPAEWGVQYVIRTGPADFSHWMVTKQVLGGALPNHCFVKDGAVWDGRDGSKYHMPEEKDFFRLCGLKWTEPSQREARWKR